MKINFIVSIIAMAAIPAFASPLCKIETELDNNYLVIQDKKIAVDDNSFKVSKLKLRNYCLLYSGDKNNLKVRFYNKKTAENYEVEQFISAKESPNSELVAVVSGDNNGSVSKISLLDKNGLRSYKHSFEFAFNADQFRFDFSANSKYLNFYVNEEFSINYSSLDLDDGNLYQNVADNDIYLRALQSSGDTSDSTFSFFVPVSNSEFAATTANNFLGYYRDGQALWTKKLTGQQGLSSILGVGTVYIVVLNETGGVDLYRNLDGKKFSVLTKSSNEFTTANLNILDSRFIASNKIRLSYRNGITDKKGRIVINLDKKVVTKE